MRCIIDDLRRILDDNIYGILEMRVNIMKKIAIISGTVRPNSNTLKVAEWLKKKTDNEPNIYELVDLMDFNLPHYNEPVSPKSVVEYLHPETQKWSEAIKQYDAYIFVIPEYNGFFPGIVKDAVDFLYHEWTNKSFGLVGIGGKGGKWACEHLQTLLERFDMNYKGYVGVTNPWTSIDKQGNVDEAALTDSLESLLKQFR